MKHTTQPQSQLVESPYDPETWPDQRDPVRWARKYAIHAYEIAADGMLVSEVAAWEAADMATAWSRATPRQRKRLQEGFHFSGDTEWDRLAVQAYCRFLGMQ